MTEMPRHAADQLMTCLGDKLRDLDRARDKVKELDSEIKTLDDEAHEMTLVCEVLKRLANLATQSAIDNLNTVVTTGLREILFDQNLEFRATQTISRGVPKIDFMFIDGGEEVSPSSVGGGLVAVTATLLTILYHRMFKLAPVLLLDETLAFLAERYQENAANFIRSLAEKFEMTILLVSHQKRLADGAHCVVESESVDGRLVAQVRQIQ